MLKLLLIAAGGATGSLSRYAVSGWGQRATQGSFPTGTLVVNLLGCLLIGFLGVLFSRYMLIREEYRLALLIGVLGGFTTLSSFGWETFALLNDGQRWQAFANVAITNVGGLGLVWVGYRIAEKLYGA